MKTTLPCRSCALWDEKNMQMFKDSVGGFLDGSCSESCEHANPEYLVYGVNTEEKGKAMCDTYEHEGFDW
jgi:hypothetical protein